MVLEHENANKGTLLLKRVRQRKESDRRISTHISPDILHEACTL